MAAEQLAKYSLIEKLATGGMAEIFLAEQSGPGGFKKRLVIKRILPHLVGDEKFIEMFQDEARIAAMMNHPNIVQIFDLGEENSAYYIAMEYVAGENLRGLIQTHERIGRWLEPEFLARVGAQVCEGLEYAHNFCDADGNHLNIIHRDVSPQNLILSIQGVTKIVDFGIAKAKSNLQETQAGIIKGKLAYMSPEQVKGKTLDRRSDLFSLGIVLYELATRQRPFGGKREMDMLRAILEAKPKSILDFRPDFPSRLDEIICRCLAQDRKDRYQSAREIQWDLERFVQDHGQPAGAFQLQGLLKLLRESELTTDRTDVDEPLSNRPPAPEPIPAPARQPTGLPSPIDAIGGASRPAAAPRQAPPAAHGGHVDHAHPQQGQMGSPLTGPQQAVAASSAAMGPGAVHGSNPWTGGGAADPTAANGPPAPAAPPAQAPGLMSWTSNFDAAPSPYGTPTGEQAAAQGLGPQGGSPAGSGMVLPSPSPEDDWGDEATVLSPPPSRSPAAQPSSLDPGSADAISLVERERFAATVPEQAAVPQDALHMYESGAYGAASPQAPAATPPGPMPGAPPAIATPMAMTPQSEAVAPRAAGTGWGPDPPPYPLDDQGPANEYEHYLMDDEEEGDETLLGGDYAFQKKSGSGLKWVLVILILAALGVTGGILIAIFR